MCPCQPPPPPPGHTCSFRFVSQTFPVIDQSGHSSFHNWDSLVIFLEHNLHHFKISNCLYILSPGSISWNLVLWIVCFLSVCVCRRLLTFVCDCLWLCICIFTLFFWSPPFPLLVSVSQLSLWWQLCSSSFQPSGSCWRSTVHLVHFYTFTLVHLLLFYTFAHEAAAVHPKH